MPITDADREAANALRVILADICGFWHSPGDDSPLCQALAQHREAAEARLAATTVPMSPLPVSRVPMSRVPMSLVNPAAADDLPFGPPPRSAPALSRRPRPQAAARLAK
jgi:hypothetical protein